MAIAVDASTPARFSTLTGAVASIVSASFTAPANSVLLLVVSGAGDVTTITPSDSVGNLVWTVDRTKLLTSGSGAWVYAAHTVVPTSAARTVTLTFSPALSTGASAKIYVLTGANALAPIGAVVGSGTSAANPLNAAAYTSTVAGSLGFSGIVDDTGATGLTSTDTFEVDGTLAIGSSRKTNVTAVAGTAVAFNWSATGTPSWAWFGLEVIPQFLAAAQTRDRDRRVTREITNRDRWVTRDRGRAQRTQFDLYHAATAPASADQATTGLLPAGATAYANGGVSHNAAVTGLLSAGAVAYTPVSHDPAVSAILVAGSVAYAAVVVHNQPGDPAGLYAGSEVYATVGHDQPASPAALYAGGLAYAAAVVHNQPAGVSSLFAGGVLYSVVGHDAVATGLLIAGAVPYAAIGDKATTGVLYAGASLRAVSGQDAAVTGLLTAGAVPYANVTHNAAVTGLIVAGAVPSAAVGHNAAVVGYLPAGAVLYGIGAGFGPIPTITYPTAFVVLPNSRLGVDLAPSGLTVELASSSLVFVAGPSGLLVPLTPPNENLDLN